MFDTLSRTSDQGLSFALAAERGESIKPGVERSGAPGRCDHYEE